MSIFLSECCKLSGHRVFQNMAFTTCQKEVVKNGLAPLKLNGRHCFKQGFSVWHLWSIILFYLWRDRGPVFVYNVSFIVLKSSMFSTWSSTVHFCRRIWLVEFYSSWSLLFFIVEKSQQAQNILFRWPVI